MHVIPRARVLMTVVPDGEAMGIIPIHFNVSAHHIPVREFVDTALSASSIIQSFSETVFDGKLRYEVVILPPEPGTFLSKLGVMVLGVPGALWAGLSSDIGKAYVKGLTGNEPAYYAEQAGLKTRNYLEADFEKDKQKSLTAISSAVADATTGFLGADYDKLRKDGFTKERLRPAFKARNEFYQACYRNVDIRGIGFGFDDHFPIERRDFPKFIIDLPDKKEEENTQRWEVEIQHLQVTSPNWDRGDTQRHWKGRVSDEKHVTFILDDDFFWHLVEERQIPTQVRDVLKVQWAFVRDLGRRKHTRVIRVLEINGRHLADPLTDEALLAVLGKFAQAQPPEPDLFG